MPRHSNLPSNVRAVFFDVDDTYFSHKLNRILEGYPEMVSVLRNQGVFCALCTARSLELVENLMGSQLGKWDGMVAGNGAFVYNENLNILFEKTLSDQTVAYLINTGEKHGAGFFVSGTSAFVFGDQIPVKPKLHSVHIEGIPEHAPGADDHLSVMSICHPDPLSMKDDLDQIDGLFVHYTKYSADISRNDLSKSEGISHLMKYWNLPDGDYAAFGDSQNDLDMLDHAACPAAMAESEPAVLEAVSTHVPPVEEGGIAAWMKKEGWIE